MSKKKEIKYKRHIGRNPCKMKQRNHGKSQQRVFSPGESAIYRMS